MPNTRGLYRRLVAILDRDIEALPSHVSKGGVEVILTHSAGSDGAMVVFIATAFEPDGSDGGPGLRVNINDDPTYEGVPYLPKPEDE